MDEKLMYKTIFLSNIFTYFGSFDFSEYEIALTDFIDRYYFKYYHYFNLICEMIELDEKYFCVKLFSTEEELQNVCKYAMDVTLDNGKMLRLLQQTDSKKVFKVNDLAMKFCEFLFYFDDLDDVKKYSYGLKQ